MTKQERTNNMTMMTMYKRCNVCGKMFSWNPNAGRKYCPYCGPLGEIKRIEKWIENLFKLN